MDCNRTPRRNTENILAIFPRDFVFYLGLSPAWPYFIIQMLAIYGLLDFWDFERGQDRSGENQAWAVAVQTAVGGGAGQSELVRPGLYADWRQGVSRQKYRDQRPLRC